MPRLPSVVFDGRAVLLSALAALLTGCITVGPEYEQPALELPAAYTAPMPGMVRSSLAAGDWWERFDDPLLSRLVDLGIRRNPDIETARSRVREARAFARGVAAGSRPALDGGVSATADLRSGGFRDDDSESEGSAEGFLLFGWDVDLFGGLERSREAAMAEARRQAALREGVALTVVAEIAETYISLRGAQRRLALAREALELQLQTLELVRRRVEAGLAPGLDRTRAQAAVATQTAELAPIRVEIDRSMNALSVLTGEAPGTLTAWLETPRPIPQMQAGASPGVPADLVRRRPDLRAAELDLVRATAEIGVATATLYPRLTLPGSIAVGLSGFGADDITETAVASLSTVLDIPLFDGGLRQANLDIAEEQAQQALIAYRQTLLLALEEVEAALIGYVGAHERREALFSAVAANELAYDQARSLYTQGLASFLDVLDAQRELTASQQSLADAETDLGLQAVALYRALGLSP